MVFTGSCNRDLFEQWLEESLVPELKPGKIVVMDNYVIHKSPKVKALIEAAGCTLIFLPPYSPDFNPIEHFWAHLKNTIRDIKHLYSNFDKAIDAAFRKLMKVENNKKSK